MKSHRLSFAPSALALAAIAGFAFAAATPARADVQGMWLNNKDGTIVRIHSCGSAICGHIASVGRHESSTTGQASGGRVSAAETSDGTHHASAGVQVLIGMRPDGPNKWSGTLYNPDDGKTYEGHLVQIGSDTVRIEGCWLGFCGGDNLTRLRGSAAR